MNDILYEIDQEFKLRIKEIRESLESVLGRKGFTLEQKLRGMEGLVFESIVHDFTKKEIKTRTNLDIAISTQQKITGRAKCDLVIENHIFIEVKKSGIYSYSPDNYRKYHNILTKQGNKYLFLNWRESTDKHVKFCKDIWEDYTFILNRGKFNDPFNKLRHDHNEWERYVQTIIKLLN